MRVNLNSKVGSMVMIQSELERSSTRIYAGKIGAPPGVPALPPQQRNEYRPGNVLLARNGVSITKATVLEKMLRASHPRSQQGPCRIPEFNFGIGVPKADPDTDFF